MDSQKEAFLQEFNELLTEVEEAVLEVEETMNTDLEHEAVNRLFRAMHSIKGIAGMFGYDSITDFTHHVESTLDLVRNGDLNTSKELITLVLRSHDILTSMIQEPPQAGGILPKPCEDIVAHLTALIGRKGIQEIAEEEQNEEEDEPAKEIAQVIYSYRISCKPKEGRLGESSSILSVFQQLKELGEASFQISSDEIPPLYDLDPTQLYVAWEIILSSEATYNEVSDLFMFIENDCEIIVDCIDEISTSEDIDDLDNDYKKLGEILVDRGALSKEKLDETLSGTSRIGDLLVEKKLVNEREVEAALVEQKQIRKIRDTKKNEISSATIRVKANKLDSLVSLVGELVTAQARLSGIASKRNDAEISSIAETLQGLVNNLRDDTMSIRMVPIGSTFTVFKRLVRDLSMELGKDINLEIFGEETELDKTVIERLKDPLVHIVRNSIDHGIESAEERVRKGKRSMGSLKITAEHIGAFVQIKVEDDGAGLNLDKIREKAIERNIISQDAQLSKQETCQLIFAPGFSTADKVTDISGRGVGMDVVKKNIEALRGTITVDTTPGEGTKIILQLPLTLAIIDGLMVEIADTPYIIPLSMVEECMDLDQEEIENVRGRQIINLRGHALPFINLRDALALKGHEIQQEQVVITRFNQNNVGLVVDKIIGGHQTVIKSLGPGLKNAKHVSGATILGDGTVALILDIRKLVTLERS